MEIANYQSQTWAGALADIRKDALSVFLKCAELGPVVKITVPFARAYMISDPAIADHILTYHGKHYAKMTRGYEQLRKLLGNGLVTSEGAFWLRQRRLAQPAFHHQRIAGFANTIIRAADEMIQSWNPLIQTSQPFLVSDAFMKVTLRIVGETLLSVDVTGDSDAVGKSVTELLEQLIWRTIRPLAIPQWVPTPRNIEFKRAKQHLDQVVYGIIAKRRQAPARDDDLLGMLLAAQDVDSGEQMTDEQLRDEVMTLFLAGHETTANLLNWTLLLVARSPHVELKMAEEVDRVLGTKVPGAEDLPKLIYLSAVIKEALRLYPPIWSLGRKLTSEDSINGWTFQKDDMVFFSPYVLHRLPGIWSRPEGFDPDRWVNPSEKVPKGAYMPFSHGPRKCIGDQFAMLEASLILIRIFQQVRLETVPGQESIPEPLITLRPRNGVRARVFARTNSAISTEQ